MGVPRMHPAELERRGSTRKNQRMDPKIALKRSTICEDPPGHLTESAKAIWHEMRDVVHETVGLSALDENALADYCQAVADVRELRSIISREGWFFETSTGQIKKHPAVDALNQRQIVVSKLARELGLTPYARLSVAPQAAIEDDEADAILRLKKA